MSWIETSEQKSWIRQNNQETQAGLSRSETLVGPSKQASWAVWMRGQETPTKPSQQKLQAGLWREELVRLWIHEKHVGQTAFGLRIKWWAMKCRMSWETRTKTLNENAPIRKSGTEDDNLHSYWEQQLSKNHHQHKPKSRNDDRRKPTQSLPYRLYCQGSILHTY